MRPPPETTEQSPPIPCDDLAAAASEAVAQARARWKTVALSEQMLTDHLRRLGVSEQTARARGADLFLACACAHRDRTALEIFEKSYLGQVSSHVARLALSADMLDEVLQAVRVRLLVDTPPRIAGYRATGPLGGWVRVAAIRIAMDLIDSARAGGPRLQSDELLHEAVLVEETSSVPPEDEIVRARCQPMLVSAVKDVVARLTDRERAVLRFHYVEGLGIDAIGVIYGVHRATVARWIAQLRRDIRKAVRVRLTSELRLSPSEFASVARILQQDVRLTISGLLG
jgi:RNA polymerase sigma-70 factor (ECF subfamily)